MLMCMASFSEDCSFVTEIVPFLTLLKKKKRIRELCMA